LVSSVGVSSVSSFDRLAKEKPTQTTIIKTAIHRAKVR
jgi:hypothetical protein